MFSLCAHLALTLVVPPVPPTTMPATTVLLAKGLFESTKTMGKTYSGAAFDLDRS